jgi:hypothetical protein
LQNAELLFRDKQAMEQVFMDERGDICTEEESSQAQKKLRVLLPITAEPASISTPAGGLQEIFPYTGQVTAWSSRIDLWFCDSSIM